MVENSKVIKDSVDFITDGFIVLGLIIVLLIFVVAGLQAINEMNSEKNLDLERQHLLILQISKIKNHLEADNDAENAFTIINRLEDISKSFNKLFTIENKDLRKKNYEYLEVACYHEYESMNKVIELIDKGIPSTHKNVLELLEVIIDGLETQYNEFILLSTEEIVQETKDLKLLQQKERNDSKIGHI